jgi:hypothetical protein
MKRMYTTRLGKGGRARKRVASVRLDRRGVASILAMMFLVMFSSLAVAMAAASQGNVRTAQTHLHVTRSMSAAETGLEIAKRQLELAVQRLQIDRGAVTAAMGRRLWAGTYNTATDGQVNVLPASNGRADPLSVRGVSDALVAAHMADANLVTGPGMPTGVAEFTSTGADLTVFVADRWVRTGVIAIDADGGAAGVFPQAYQITYAPRANGTDVRIIVTGFSGVGASGSSYQWGASATDRAARPVQRTIQQDFRMSKRPAHAMLSPSRIMIGKNVSVVGNLGARFTDVTQVNGDPIQSKSDFSNLNDPSLDAKLARFHQGVEQYDVDGDNRIRPAHPTESLALPGGAELATRGWTASTFSDATRDNFVDEFDIFINHYDVDRSGDVVLSTRLTAGTPAQGRTPEFTLDDDLAFLIDSGNADRNRNGIAGYANPADNNVIAPTSALLDTNDRTLGYRDGVISWRDQYGKVRGRMIFSTTSNAWATARGGTFDPVLRGTFVPPAGQSATRFGASTTDLPIVDAAALAATQTPLQSLADGTSFEQQVASQLGIATTALATYTEAKADPTSPRYWRADLVNSYVFSRTGRNIWEPMPFNSPSFADIYYRGRYENMTFRNVQIPLGNNGLFINCRFIGVTFVRSTGDNTHPNWTLYGAMSLVGGVPAFKTDPLDKSDFLRYSTGNVADGPTNYAAFPDPPVIQGTTRTGAARNTKLWSNNIRFHDCLFVGSITSDVPLAYTNVRNKLQFTGGTRFTSTHPTEPSNAALNPDPADMTEINKSSMMLPNYSVDVGQFNAPTDATSVSGAPASQNIQLRGSIVAGVMDIRGNAVIDGALFLTFAPVLGQGPLQQFGSPVGNPSNFNTTIGYFGPDDGDGEAVDPGTLPLVGGQRIVGWDTDGDGIADMPSSEPQPAGSTPIPFYGYGRVRVLFNPTLAMPDGIRLPLSLTPVDLTYREGRQ